MTLAVCIRRDDVRPKRRWSWRAQLLSSVASLCLLFPSRYFLHIHSEVFYSDQYSSALQPLDFQ